MSWHCVLCGEQGEKGCTGFVTYYDIRGSIPQSFVCHLKCLANAMYNYADQQDENGIIKEIYDTDKFIDNLDED